MRCCVALQGRPALSLGFSLSDVDVHSQVSFREPGFMLDRFEKTIQTRLDWLSDGESGAISRAAFVYATEWLLVVSPMPHFWESSRQVASSRPRFR